MADLFNAQTGEKEVIEDPQQLQEALEKGTHSYKKGEKVFVRNRFGEKGYLPSEQVPEALQSGYTVQTPMQEAAHEYVQENDSLSGAAKVFAGQFADEALMGIPELVYDKTADPYDVAKWEALKKHWSGVNTLGGLTGFGASMFAGGPAWRGAAAAGESVGRLTVKGVEKILAAKSLGKVGDAAIKKAAEKIVATGAEGALLSAPYAFTEAALGDPDNAAETLMAGGGIGALFGGATFLGRGMQRLTKNLTARMNLTPQTVAKRASRVLTGVPEDDIERLAKMSLEGRLDDAAKIKSVEGIKDDMDAAVSQFAEDASRRKEIYKQAEDELSQAYKERLVDLRTAKPPEQVADDLLGALEEQKAVLGEMSERAYAALDEVDGFLAQNKLTKAIDDQINLLGVVREGDDPIIIGKTYKSALKELEELKQDVARLPEQIDLRTAKTILKQIDPDINWAMKAGEFNPIVQRAKKDFRRTISEELKKVSTEYADIMTEMSSRSQILQDMSKRFGTKEKAIGKLNSLTRPTGSTSDDLLTKFDEITGSNFQGALTDWKAQKALLEESRKRNISDKLVPDLVQKRDEALANLKQAEEVYSKIKRLTPASTQNIIRNQGFKTASIENRRAIEELERLTGSRFLEDIADRNALDSFYKANTQGSRNTLMGTVAGSVLGSIVGGPLFTAIGAATGYSGDIYSSRVLKWLIEGNPQVSGLLFTEQAIKRQAKRLDDIPAIFQRMSEKKKRLPKSRTMGIQSLNRMFQIDKEESKEKRRPKGADLSRTEKGRILKKANEKLEIWATEIEANHKKLTDLTGPLAQEGAPEIAAKLSGKMMRAITYLKQEIPKPLAPNSLFAPKIEWQPSDYETNKFLQKAQIVDDPLSILGELESGTVTLNHMDALKNIYPQMYGYLVNRITRYATENPTALSYKDRLNLSIVMGQAIDPSISPERIASYQSMYEDPKGDLPGTEQMEISERFADNYKTETQRLA